MAINNTGRVVRGVWVTDVTLLSAVSTGTSSAVNLLGAQTENGIYITWGAGVTAGAVQIETAPTEDYAGTWAPVGSPIAAIAASTVDYVQLTGCFLWVRTRVSTTVSGGTVSTQLVAR